MTNTDNERIEEWQLEDTLIVDEYLRRNEDAIKMTSEKYGRKLRSISYGIVRDSGAAEECENDTYHEAWNSIPPHEPRDYFFAYLARITRHLSLSLCRHRNALRRKGYVTELTREMQESIPSGCDGGRLLDDLIFKEAFRGFLSGLPEEKRILFMRRYWYMDSIEELSERFGYSESKVKTTLFRLRKQLRKYLEREGVFI